MMTPKEVAAVAAKALDDRKGVDIRLLEITDVATLADYFLLCTGTSARRITRSSSVTVSVTAPRICATVM